MRLLSERRQAATNHSRPACLCHVSTLSRIVNCNARCVTVGDERHLRNPLFVRLMPFIGAYGLHSGASGLDDSVTVCRAGERMEGSLGHLHSSSL